MNYPDKTTVLALCIDLYVERRNSKQTYGASEILSIILEKLGFDEKASDHPNYFELLGNIVCDGDEAYKSQFTPKGIQTPDEACAHEKRDDQEELPF